MQEVNDRISVEVDRGFIKKESQIYGANSDPKKSYQVPKV